MNFFVKVLISVVLIFISVIAFGLAKELGGGALLQTAFIIGMFGGLRAIWRKKKNYETQDIEPLQK